MSIWSSRFVWQINGKIRKQEFSPLPDSKELLLFFNVKSSKEYFSTLICLRIRWKKIKANVSLLLLSLCWLSLWPFELYSPSSLWSVNTRRRLLLVPPGAGRLWREGDGGICTSWLYPCQATDTEPSYLTLSRCVLIAWDKYWETNLNTVLKKKH